MSSQEALNAVDHSANAPLTDAVMSSAVMTAAKTSAVNTNTAKVDVRPWWKEPYVWMVIGGPASAVIACAITAVYILRGPDAIVSEEQYREGVLIMREVQAASAQMQPARTARNHVATGGVADAKP